MASVEATIRDQSTSALVPVEGVAVTATLSNPTSGQVIRQTIAIGDGSGSTNFATVTGNALNVNVSTPPHSLYYQIAASHAVTGGSPIVVSATPVLYYGVENLSVSDLGSGVVITVYDSTASASGPILGQFTLGASQSIYKAIPVLPTNGIVVAISGSALNSDGGVNIYHG